MFTTAIAWLSTAFIARHQDDLEVAFAGPVMLDMFAWFIFGMYLGVL